MKLTSVRNSCRIVKVTGKIVQVLSPCARLVARQPGLNSNLRFHKVHKIFNFHERRYKTYSRFAWNKWMHLGEQADILWRSYEEHSAVCEVQTNPNCSRNSFKCDKIVQNVKTSKSEESEMFHSSVIWKIGSSDGITVI